MAKLRLTPAAPLTRKRLMALSFGTMAAEVSHRTRLTCRLGRHTGIGSVHSREPGGATPPPGADLAATPADQVWLSIEHIREPEHMHPAIAWPIKPAAHYCSAHMAAAVLVPARRVGGGRGGCSSEIAISRTQLVAMVEGIGQLPAFLQAQQTSCQKLASGAPRERPRQPHVTNPGTVPD